MKALRYALAFLSERTPQSMTRLCALILCLCVPYALHLGRDWQTIGALVGGGVVALLTRKKTPDPDGDA